MTLDRLHIWRSGPRRRARVHEYRDRALVEAPLREVFAFFADASNLEKITPEWLRFRIVTPMPIEMREGAVIEYRLRIRGLPQRWRTRIAAWEPPDRFVDVQESGPYRMWEHEHRFVDRDDRTEVIDHVRYELPFGPLGRLAHRLFVRADVERIFRHRREALARLFGREERRS